jgi:hypothetical protein
VRHRISIFLFLISLLQLEVTGQHLASLQQLGEIKGQFVYMKADLLGNIFTLGQGGQLKKYNAVFDSTGVFNEVKRFGQLHGIKAENPLRTLLYFKSYKTILLLDRFMQVVNRIDLRKTNIFQVNAIAQSYDNKIWLYDELDARLKKLNDQGVVEIETGDLRLLLGLNPNPDDIFELDKYVCMYDPTNGLMLFDQLGAYRNTIPLIGWNNVHGIGDIVIGLHRGKLMGYHLKSLKIMELLDLTDLTIELERQVVVSGQRLYILGQKGIVIYSIPVGINKQAD